MTHDRGSIRQLAHRRRQGVACGSLAIDGGTGAAKRRRAGFIGNLHQRIDDSVGVIAEPGLCPITTPDITGAAVTPISPGQHAGLERTPWCYAQTKLARHRHQIALNGALQQRIFELQRYRRCPAPASAAARPSMPAYRKNRRGGSCRPSPDHPACAVSPQSVCDNPSNASSTDRCNRCVNGAAIQYRPQQWICGQHHRHWDRSHASCRRIWWR